MSQPPPPYQPGFPGGPGMPGGPMNYGYGGYPPQPSRTSASAITSLIFGILGCIPFASGVVAIITGAIGIKATGNPNVRGRGMAIAGLILGVLSVLGWGISCLFMYAAYQQSGPARVVALQFMKDLANGNVTAAQAESLNSVPVAQLQLASDTIQNDGGATDEKLVVGFAFSNNNGVKTASCNGVVTTKKGQAITYTIILTEVNGTWEVQQFNTQ